MISIATLENNGSFLATMPANSHILTVYSTSIKGIAVLIKFRNTIKHY